MTRSSDETSPHGPGRRRRRAHRRFPAGSPVSPRRALGVSPADRVRRDHRAETMSMSGGLPGRLRMTRLPGWRAVALLAVLAALLFTVPSVHGQSNERPNLEVRFGLRGSMVTEGRSTTIRVILNDPQSNSRVRPGGEVVIPITATPLDGATSTDYTIPTSLTFPRGVGEKTFQFVAISDEEDDDGEGVRLGFGTLPDGVSVVRTHTVRTVRISDGENVKVSFGSTHNVVSEGRGVSVEVQLNTTPRREVVIPITATHLGGASSTDYSGVPSSLTFTSDEWEKTFTFEAASDDDDDGEAVRLGFGESLPAGVSKDRDATTMIRIVDDGRIDMGLAQVGIALTAAILNDDDETVCELGDENCTVAWQWQRSDTQFGGYSDIPATAGGTSNPYVPSQDDLGKWLKVKATYDVGSSTGRTAQGTAPYPVMYQPVVSNASHFHFAMVGVLHDTSRDEPLGERHAQRFTTGPDTRGYLLRELRMGINGGAYRQGTWAGSWAIHADDGGKPADQPIVAARPIQNSELDESIYSFVVLAHPDGVPLRPSTKYWIVISKTSTHGDLGITVLTVLADAFGDSLPVMEVTTEEQQGVCIRDGLEDTEEQRFPCVPIMDEGSQHGWTIDLASLSLQPDRPLTNHPVPHLAPWTTLASAIELEPHLVVRTAIAVYPVVTVEFDADSYTVAEGDTQTVTVELSADPLRTITIPVTTTDMDGAESADYSGVPASVTFNAGETSQTFTFTATQDTVDDDDERVKLGFGTMPDAWVSGGKTDESIISITDDDDPEVTVQFGQASQRVGEGETVNVTISLSADPERTLSIPVTATPQGMASASDYTVPTSVTFNAGETEKTIAFAAAQDTVDDDDESVKLGFGTMPDARVTAGTRTETTLNINDDDDPEVVVQFGASTYAVAESDDATTSNKTENQIAVAVTLDKDPERTIIIPITTTLQGTASDADYSGVPASVTFNSGDTSNTFSFAATQDLIDDDGEGVKLEFGTMPDPRVSAGTTDESTVSITDDDTAGIVLSETTLTVTEEQIPGASYTVVLATEPTVNVTVTLTGHAGTDLTLGGVKLSGDALTFTPDNWSRPQTVMVTAAHDDDGVGDDVTLTHTAAGGEYAGVTGSAPVTVTDNDPLGITIAPSPLEVEESASADYTVALATEPTENVTVTISGHAGTDLTLSTSTLTFTAANWDTPQTVTVSAAHDEDIEDDTETLTHTGGGGEYANIESALTVTIADNTGDLRLVGGTLTDGDGTACEGRLEVYYDGKWGTVCDDYWTEQEADVACRQLGFVGGSVEDLGRFKTAYFRSGTSDQDIVLDDVYCQGYESELMRCSSHTQGQISPKTHNCRHSEDVGLRCVRNSEGPYVTGMVISGPPGDNGKYDKGETVTITVTWSEAVEVELDAVALEDLPPYCCHHGPPRVWLSYAEYVWTFNIANYFTSPHADYDRGSGTDTLVFEHTIEEFGGKTSFDWIAVVHESLQLRQGLITSVETGRSAILGHGWYESAGAGMQTATQTEAVTITSGPTFNDAGDDGVFETGDTVEVFFTFSRPVRVDTTGGAPSVKVRLGGTMEREAAYLRGSGSGRLVFGYTLADADGTHDSLLVGPNALSLNGGAIRDVNYNQDADITHEGAGAIFIRQVVANTPATGAPTISGTAQVGETLTASTTGIVDIDGLTNATYTYQWLADDAAISGAASSTYTLTTAEQGKAIKVRVTFTDDAGNEETLTSAATGAVAARPGNNDNGPNDVSPPAVNTPATGAPTISGTAQVGEMLTASATGIVDIDGLTNATFTYQWLADDTNIGGATSSTYTLTTGEQGKAIKVRVTFADDASNEETLTSAATTAVAAKPNTPATGAPTISGTAQVGQTLTASTTGIADSDGLTNATFSYQWLADDAAISGATGSTYTLTTAEQGKAIKVRVTFADDASNEETLTSAATDAVTGAETIASAPEATIAPGTSPVAEGAPATFTVTLDEAAQTALSVAVSVADPGGVLSGTSPTSVDFAAGDTGKTITLPTHDDDVIETASEVTVSLATGSGYTLGTTTTASVSVTDNDQATWTVAAQPAGIDEGGASTITVTVANGKTFAAGQAISLDVTGTASGSDYTLSAAQLTLSAGANSATATVTATDDALVEGDETVIVTASHAGQSIGSATVTIAANDAPLSNDANLSSLALSGIDIGAFHSDTTSYSADVEHTVSSTTVTATPGDENAGVTIADAAGTTRATSRAVSLSYGDNEITVTVTAEDGNATKVYTVTVTRAQPEVAWGQRLSDRDITLDSDSVPTGIWSDGTNMWVVTDCYSGKVDVYSLSDGSKQDELGFTLPDWADCAAALWSDGATMWVAGLTSSEVLAYRLSDGARQPGKDLDQDTLLDAGNAGPSGLWSDGEIMWVADRFASKAFAYRLSDGARMTAREFDLVDDDGAAITPFGLWSNGETLLASSWTGDGRVLAYDLSTGDRKSGSDIDTSASGTAHTSGVWSNGETLWVVDDIARRIYAYAVPGLGAAP